MTTDVATQACQHHWVLSDPREGVVVGTCKFCKSTREYPARLTEDDYADGLDDLTDVEDRRFMAHILERVRESL
ncbi:MAG TPA: hypothetical protein VIO14_02815 [Dehalococcoidia bacterium]